MKISDPNNYLSYGNKSWFFLVSGNEKEGWAYRLGYYCRESFSGYLLPDIKMIGYIHRIDNDVLDVAKFTEFWREVEKRVGVKQEVIHVVEDLPGVIMMEVDPWWMMNTTRQAFFTLLMRAGARYYRGDFDKALTDYPLAASIIPTVRHFLAGHTTPTYESKDLGGARMVNTYMNMAESELKNRLIKIHS